MPYVDPPSALMWTCPECKQSFNAQDRVALNNFIASHLVTHDPDYRPE